jgi:hypothetical protein
MRAEHVSGDDADQNDKPASLGGPARFAIGAAVLLLGMLVGAAIAACVLPPA